jgi:hypothetical protein
MRYNYERFRPSLLMKDVQLMRDHKGPEPGDPAPDFALRDTAGHSWNLRDLRGQPVVLIIGSATCPMTRGALPGLMGVHRDYADRAQWLFLYVREAHPGDRLREHENFEQKSEQAEYFRGADRVPWPVLVDDVEGTLHQRYGLLPNSVFLIDVEGRVAFRGDFSHGPTLRRALDDLFEQGGRGPVPDATDRMMHMLGPTAYGWEAIRRAGPRAVRDLVVGVPPMAANLWMGSKLQPALDPVASRSQPVPVPIKAGLGAAAAALAYGIWKLFRRRRQRQ